MEKKLNKVIILYTISSFRADKRIIRKGEIKMEQNKHSWISALIIGLSVMISCAAIAYGLSHFRSESTHVIAATGSSSVDFEADIIIWRGSFSAVAYTSQDAYSKIKSDADRVKKYLTENGISEDEIVFNSVDIGRTYSDNYDMNGNYI